ncbi:uncharacterized protein TRIADDRAFT_51948 [Trichoplax adhaerens]|uniref:Uncharacterized protein n=1 Tax=Trichoplax adhaerens TaxID=10228 RepID=B3RLB5_TRIAD|nr:predicted protein [Trichoplax adhaerens]EDV28737.1 predicted protein [Trichoplax adhaerens]|eukprot:XP_002107939.1 predicted protein [Trichoplax adhaerens]
MKKALKKTKRAVSRKLLKKSDKHTLEAATDAQDDERARALEASDASIVNDELKVNLNKIQDEKTRQSMVPEFAEVICEFRESYNTYNPFESYSPIKIFQTVEDEAENDIVGQEGITDFSNDMIESLNNRSVLNTMEGDAFAAQIPEITEETSEHLKDEDPDGHQLPICETADVMFEHEEVASVAPDSFKNEQGLRQEDQCHLDKNHKREKSSDELLECSQEVIKENPLNNTTSPIYEPHENPKRTFTSVWWRIFLRCCY